MKQIANKEQKPLTEADILRKLEKAGVDSAEEYEMIILNLQQQNERLLKDRDELQIRVNILKEKQKSLIEEQGKPKRRNPSTDYQRIKKELQRKYKQYENWQKKCYNSMNKNAINTQIRQHVNSCVLIQNEIREHRKLLEDERKAFKKLQKSIKGQLKDMNRNVPQREILEEQNRQLRRRIWNLRIVEDLTGHVEVRVQNNMVGLQNKKRFIEKLKTMTVQQIKREQTKTKMSIINHQVRLKNHKSIQKKKIHRMKTQSIVSSRVASKFSSNLQETMIKQEQEIQNKEKELQIKEEHKKQLQKQLEELLNKKQESKKMQQSIEKKLKEQEEDIEAKIREEEKVIEMEDVCLQINMYEDETPLRREIIGVQQETTLQDDRLMLKGMKQLEITGFMAYENKYGLAYVMALYSNGKHTPFLLPQLYLGKHCKAKKMILHDPKDYLQWIKAYHDKESNQILRLQIFSHNKIRFQAGKPKQQILKTTTSFKFDNLSNEIPVSIRASYSKKNQDWVMASFGVEFNTK